MSANTARQPSLFEPEQPYDAQVVRNIDGHDVVTTYGPEGSYVDVVERAKNLIIALVSMSERNRRDGFSIAPYTEEYSEPIWAHYRWNTQDVIDGASRNRNSYQQQLRKSFWRATGFSAMRGAGFMPERQINPRAQKMWRDFNKEFGHPDGVKKRSDYRKALSRQIGDPDAVTKTVVDAVNREAI
jgi:hypothetical protein